MIHIRTAKYTDDKWSLIEKDNGTKYTEHPTSIHIDSTKQYQKIIGFGGAFTEASGYNLSRISNKKQEQALKAYFDPKDGLKYNIGRVSIHSCDFSLGSYTYVKDYDTSLKSFDISRDFQYIIPMIQEANRIADQNIPLLASPWTPVWWMKSNQSPIRGGKLLLEYYDLWAEYVVQFIKEYQEQGLNIWGVTIQNEPQAVQRWDSCIYTAEEERNFIVKNLGPTMKQADLDDVKVLIWDHNRDLMVERAAQVLSNPEASKYVWGVAFHWYVSEDFSQVGKTHDLFPEKHLLFTEGCQEGGPHFGVWETGERYGRNMIGDFNNWTEGYIDWNLFLDDTGGPNHVNNLCDAPVMIKIFQEEIVYQSSYYYIGHFSRYIEQGATRIDTKTNDQRLKIVAFENPNKKIILIVQNDTEEDIDCAIHHEISSSLTFIKRSISTIIL